MPGDLPMVIRRLGEVWQGYGCYCGHWSGLTRLSSIHAFTLVGELVLGASETHATTCGLSTKLGAYFNRQTRIYHAHAVVADWRLE